MAIQEVNNFEVDYKSLQLRNLTSAEELRELPFERMMTNNEFLGDFSREKDPFDFDANPNDEDFTPSSTANAETPQIVEEIATP